MTTHPNEYPGAHRHDEAEPRLPSRGRHRAADDDDRAIAPVIPLFGRHPEQPDTGANEDGAYEDGAYDEWYDDDGGLILRYTDPDGLGAS
jgi:hypothetical protein